MWSGLNVSRFFFCFSARALASTLYCTSPSLVATGVEYSPEPQISGRNIVYRVLQTTGARIRIRDLGPDLVLGTADDLPATAPFYPSPSGDSEMESVIEGRHMAAIVAPGIGSQEVRAYDLGVDGITSSDDSGFVVARTVPSSVLARHLRIREGMVSWMEFPRGGGGASLRWCDALSAAGANYCYAGSSATSVIDGLTSGAPWARHSLRISGPSFATVISDIFGAIHVSTPLSYFSISSGGGALAFTPLRAALDVANAWLFYSDFSTGDLMMSYVLDTAITFPFVSAGSASKIVGGFSLPLYGAVWGWIPSRVRASESLHACFTSANARGLGREPLERASSRPVGLDRLRGLFFECCD